MFNVLCKEPLSANPALIRGRRTAALPVALMCLCLFCAQAALAQAPLDCQASAAHRAFDFWLGSWVVTDPSGKRVGTNEIRSVQDGCALEERWTSVRGTTGQSINYYHPLQGEWRQLWVDGGSSIIDIRGGIVEGEMLLEGTILYLATGEEKGFRGRWTPLEDGRVRQFFEQETADGGWETWFEGFYSLRE